MYISAPKSHRGLRCTGSEQRLQDCPFTSFFVDYYDLIYLRCQPISLTRKYLMKLIISSCKSSLLCNI